MTAGPDRHMPTLTETETATGHYVDLLQPQPDTIFVEDIAHHLANICRFGGACGRRYSVAEHAVIVSNLVAYVYGRPELALAALHHDDAEAYLGDIPRPLKPLLGSQYKVLTLNMDLAIAKALGNRWTTVELHDPVVKRADNVSLRYEADVLLPSRGYGWHFGDEHTLPSSSRPSVVGMDLETARGLFLEKHHMLVAEMVRAA